MKTKIFIYLFSLLSICYASKHLFKYYQKNIYRPYLTVIGFIEMTDGLGRQSAEAIDALRNDVSIRFKSTREGFKTNEFDKPLKKILRKKSNKIGKVVLYEDIFHKSSYMFFEKYLKKNEDSIVRFAYSMFESSEIPPYFVHNLNLYFDAVVVPDEYFVSVYKNSGVSIPIFVLPLGLNLSNFLNAPLKRASNTPFVFANFSSLFLRKNQKKLINAFYKAFGDDPTVKLWINGRHDCAGIYEDLSDHIKTLGVSNILLTNICYDKKSYLENFLKVDCYVSLSLGEGFSIQPREAMALGIPTITSNSTAQDTICKSNLGMSLEASIPTPAYYEHFKELFGFQFDVDEEEVCSALIEMKNNYSSYLQKSDAMRAWASSYDYKNVKKHYKSLIAPQKIILGETNQITEDGFITNSKEFFDKCKKILK